MQTADKITIPFEQSHWLSHMAITILVGVIINNLTLHSGYALTPAHDASSYTSHLMWYTPFWSPLGIFRKVQIRLTKLQTSHHLSTISGYLYIAKDLLVV